VTTYKGNARVLSHLQDMGFDAQLAAHIQQNIHSIAKWDANDNLIDFDLTKLPDMKAAEAFAAAVNRGTKQIIQGTYVGEKSAWFHNDWLKLALQLRTYSMVSVEKQWGRQRMNHGYGYAAGAFLGQAAWAMPIYLARIHAASIGREDQQEYVKKQMHPAVMARALMNYGSMTGLMGEALDATFGIAGGWNDSVKGAVGPLAGTSAHSNLSVTNVIPSLGMLDSMGRAATGGGTVYGALKQLPFTNMPQVAIPLNLIK
jgi:hypothetical protein